MAHTKGPWYARGRRIYSSEDRRLIGEASSIYRSTGVENGRRVYCFDDESEPNACLFALAPEMLVLLESIVAKTRKGKPLSYSELRDDLLAAEKIIAKAKGGQQ